MDCRHSPQPASRPTATSAAAPWLPQPRPCSKACAISFDLTLLDGEDPKNLVSPTSRSFTSCSMAASALALAQRLRHQRPLSTSREPSLDASSAASSACAMSSCSLLLAGRHTLSGWTGYTQHTLHLRCGLCCLQSTHSGTLSCCHLFMHRVCAATSIRHNASGRGCVRP